MDVNKWMHGYAVELHCLEDGDFLTYIVELGHSACSNVGGTIPEALEELEGTLKSVLEVMKEGETRIPEPQGDPAEEPRCNLTSVSQQLWYRPTDPAVLAQVQHVIRHKQLELEEKLDQAQTALVKCEEECRQQNNDYIESCFSLTTERDRARAMIDAIRPQMDREVATIAVNPQLYNPENAVIMLQHLAALLQEEDK